MLSAYRAAIFDLLRASLGVTTAVWHQIPDDIAELPCVVVGRPGVMPASDAGIADLSIEIFVLGRRQQAGDYEKELLDLADEVWTACGGTTGTTSGDYQLSIRSILPRVLVAAGNEINTYAIAVLASESTC